MATSDPPDDDAELRKARAKSLHDQIREIIEHAHPPGRPSSLRSFIEEKMAEDRDTDHPTDDSTHNPPKA